MLPKSVFIFAMFLFISCSTWCCVEISSCFFLSKSFVSSSARTFNLSPISLKVLNASNFNFLVSCDNFFATRKLRLESESLSLFYNVDGFINWIYWSKSKIRPKSTKYYTLTLFRLS